MDAEEIHFYVLFVIIIVTNTTLINGQDLKFENDSDAYNSTNVRLHRFLLKKYDKHMRPVLHPNDNITVTIQGAPYQIINVDQKRNLIEISAFFEMSWTDEYLQWNPVDYENATEVFLSSSSIWKPDLVLYYSSDHQKSLLESRLNVHVSFEGRVRYFVPFTGEGRCPIDVKYFPFDVQNCTLYFGSWTHSNDGVHLKLLREGKPSLDAFYDNQEWMLLNCSLTEHFDFMKPTNQLRSSSNGSSIAVIAFQMTIGRQSFYYVFNLVIPSALITIVAVIGFHMPSLSTGGRYTKFRLGMMTLLSMSVLLLSVVTEMPKFAISAEQGNFGSFSGVPLIGIYYFNLLAIISCATVTSSWFVSCEKKMVRSGVVPWYFKWLKDGDCLRVMSKRGYQTTSRTEANNMHYSHRKTEEDLLELPESGNVVNLNIINAPLATEESISESSNMAKGFRDLHNLVQEAINNLDAVKVVLKDPLSIYDDNGVSTTLGRLEMISLYFYLFLVFLTIFMFFVHTWWY